MKLNLLKKTKPKMTKEMGYISNVKDARKSLRISLRMLNPSFEPHRVIVHCF